MKFFARSALEYIRGQTQQLQGSAKMLFMMPSLPPYVVKDVGDGLDEFCSLESNTNLILKVAAPLADEWRNSGDSEQAALCEELAAKEWCDDKGNLTKYRNSSSSDGRATLILLIGVDRVTDAASLADFHHCDFSTVWQSELRYSFDAWIRWALDEKNIGYESDTVQHFDWILQSLVERGLADILQISDLLQHLDLTAAQDGRDAEKALLSGLGQFGLPNFQQFKFSTSRAFGSYLDSAVTFFTYDAFLEDEKRKRALKAIHGFRELNPLGEAFDPSERGTFETDVAFMDSLSCYVETGDAEKRGQLLNCDFPTIKDRILDFKEPREGPKTRETVRKLSGSPIEMALSALWMTLRDFKKAAAGRGLFAHEILKSIQFETQLFKHDCDGESSSERAQRARAYLAKLLGGVDRYLEGWIDLTRMSTGDRSVDVRSELLQENVRCRAARTAEPVLQFKVILDGEGLGKPVSREFAWRLPAIHPYRVADELIQWAADRLKQAGNYCLPVFHVPYYEELILAKDDEETRRVLLHCIHDEADGLSNLFNARELPKADPLRRVSQKLALEYGRFIQIARAEGIHTALLEAWDNLRKAHSAATGAYLSLPSSDASAMAPMLFRSFLLIDRPSPAEADRWIWEPFEPSCAVTILHPALLEMLQAQIVYLLTAFSTVASQELRSPGTRSFSDERWHGYVDLATIQTPLTGLLKDNNRILDTDVRGTGLIHRIGHSGQKDAPLTTRLLLRYDAFEDEDVSDAELFRSSRESQLISRILHDYRALHPHAEDGLAIAVYQNQDIQPLIAAVDKFLESVCKERPENANPYAMSVTVFTESSDDSSVARWVGQWKERWEAAETESRLARYRKTQLSVAHRIVSSGEHYGQFVELVETSLDVDIAILNRFIRAGAHGNEFEPVEPYDVTTRTLKFPILEKSFCSLDAPGKGLQRARVLSNRQFRISASHAEVMARLKNKSTPRDDQHVVLGFGDYQPWQALVDVLHHRAEWVVCIDPNVDAQLIAQKAGATHEAREIIGFGSGVGTHGEANFTISTEQFRLSDVLYKLTVSIEELCSSWSSARIAESVLDESRRLSGLSLVRATGIGQYIRDFMAYALTRKLLKTDEDVLCDQLVSLDAFHHWFDSAYSDVRPDLLWLTATVGESGRLRLDLRLIECKLAKRADTHLEKAREQLESGLEHLISVFMPRTDAGMVEDERPDQRYWWLQLHRLIASNSKILGRDQKRVLSALERLAEGEFDVSWRAAAVTFWTDQSKADISQTDSWPFSIEGLNMNIGIVSCGTEFVQALCEKQADSTLPWSESCVQFRATGRSSLDEPNDDADEARDGAPDETPKGVVKRDALPDIGPPHSEAEVHATRSLTTETHRPQIPGRILLGQSISGSRDVYWEFGHSELNNRHMLIFGTSGMGKTYTIQCLLFELGRVGQNSLIVDYTNGFFDSQLESVFRSKLQPIQHVIKKEPLSINPFRQQIGLVVDEPLPEAASSTAQRVSGVFSEVYSFGDQQKSALYQAIKTGLERSGTRGMTLVDLLPLLEELAEEKGTVGQAAGSVASKIIPFVDQNPFGEEDPESWEKIFTDITNRCHILQLSGFAKDSTRLVTEFSLIDLYSFYRSRGTQHSPRVVVLDEIQNLDHREESPLAQLLCEGRKFGFSLILATQIMSSLNRDERDRLFNAAHKLFFRPADTEIKTYAEIAAVSTGEKADVWVKRLAKLKKGQCYSIGPSLNEVSGELEVKAFSIQISPLNKRIMNV